MPRIALSGSPVEGTMLTVIREMAEAAESSETHGLDHSEFLAVVLARGEESLARTPELLAILREAGVVDAGGAGLLEILRGMRAAIAGETISEVPVEAVELSFEAMHMELSEFRYCTVFVIEGQGLDADGLEVALDRLGDSLLVVGDSTALKVHVHTDDPGAALTLGTASGTIDASRDRRHAPADRSLRESRLVAGALDHLPTLETGVVVVAPGAGNRRLFENLGATRVIDGGQTMNPATEDIVAAVNATPATEVIVLPNNKNVILGAEQAVGHANKPLRIVPTLSVQAGLAAMVVYDSERSPPRTRARWCAPWRALPTGEVTIASRDCHPRWSRGRQGRMARARRRSRGGERPSFDAVAVAVAERLLEGGREILTLLTGADEPDARDRSSRRSVSAIPRSRSRSTRAGSRTTRCSSRRNDDDCEGAARRGQRGLPLDARVAARRAGGPRGGWGRR